MNKRPSIPEETRTRLWVLAGGRCQYEGCNKPLWRDDLTMTEMNRAFIAHIVDVNPHTHRYDPILAKKLAKEISNLMLLCHEDHRRIDYEEELEHTVARLTRMKSQHEVRIEHLTSLQEQKKSHILTYGANIGEQDVALNWHRVTQAMLPERYPAEPRAIQLSLNSALEDSGHDYWNVERLNLRQNLHKSLRPRIVSGEVGHLSIFALAPQPLLIELGRLLTDIPAAEVYQLHREPPDWKWQDSPNTLDFLIEEPATKGAIVALNLSLSATIDNSRITAALPDGNLSIWRMTIPTPHNDFLKSREQLRIFRETFRQLLDRIKARHGQGAQLHVFPAVPVSVAVEIGRVWMPKADLALTVYDQNQKMGGFKPVLQIVTGEGRDD